MAASWGPQSPARMECFALDVDAAKAVALAVALRSGQDALCRPASSEHAVPAANPLLQMMGPQAAAMGPDPLTETLQRRRVVCSGQQQQPQPAPRLRNADQPGFRRLEES